MIYEDLIRDFAGRTQKNLCAIERLRADGQEVFETTQLVNSMLGLLVFPREQFIDQIPKTSLLELREAGWPVPIVPNEFSQVTDLRELTRYLRNAIAHFNIEFIADESGEITGLRVWNTDQPGEKKTWEAELSLSDLRGIAERFTGLLLQGVPPTSP